MKVGSKIQWRVKATEECSPSSGECSLFVPLTNGEHIDADIAAINEGGKLQYLVFAHLHVNGYHAYRYQPDLPEIVATWFRPKPPENQKPHILLPNAYKFIGCLKSDELEAGAN